MSSVVLRSIASTHADDGEAVLADRLDADMRHVLDTLKGLEPRPIETCTAEQARAQPTVMTAMRLLLRDRMDDGGAGTEERTIWGPGGDLKTRLYRPAANENGAALPLILYFHGGGFVVGDLDRDDETPRALARRCGAIVVSVHYRQGPEHKLPAAHEDALAAWQWVIANAESLGGDKTRLAVVGEEAGGNLALNVALAARDEKGAVPRHVALIGPMLSTDFGRASYNENSHSRPLSAPGVRWSYKKAVRRNGLGDPRLNLIGQDFAGLPPVTLVNAAIDPLRSEGEALAHGLRRDGVWVDATVYDGVTAQFIGLARIVNKAMFAQGQIVRNLNESLS